MSDSVKVKEDKGLRGGVQVCAAQTIPQTDTEIVKKRHFWMETRLGVAHLPYDSVGHFYLCTGVMVIGL